MAAFAIASAAIAFLCSPLLYGSAPPAMKPSLADAPEAAVVVRESHRQIAEFVDRRENEAEAKAQAEARAREAARFAALREAEERRAQQQRMLEAARRAAQAQQLAARPEHRKAETRKPAQQQMPEAPAGDPLAIVPPAPGKPQPRGPVESVAAAIGDMKDRTLSTLGDIGGWFVRAGSRIFNPDRPLSAPSESRLSDNAR